MHELRSVRFAPFRCDTPAFESTGFEIFDQYIGFAEKGFENFLSARLFEIERNATFVAIDAKKVSRFIADKRRAPPAGVIARAGPFDLDQLSAPISPKFMAQKGPAKILVRSITRMPFKGPSDLLVAVAISLVFNAVSF